MWLETERKKSQRPETHYSRLNLTVDVVVGVERTGGLDVVEVVEVVVGVKDGGGEEEGVNEGGGTEEVVVAILM